MRIAADGMQTAQALLGTHAHNIARLGTPEAEAGGVDLATEVVGLITARTMYTANARVFATLAETQGSLLDVLA